MKNMKWIALPLLSNFLLGSSAISGAIPVAIVAAVALPGCVTVNVNIPDQDLQKASDDYVRELYEEKAKTKPKPSPSPSVSASPALEKSDSSWNFIPAAQADELHGRSSITRSAKLDALMQKMKSRIPETIPLKKAGILGESRDGKLVLKNRPAQGLKKAEALVEAMNQDRADVYKEVLAHNHFPKNSLPIIERNFAHAFQKHSPSGTWVQAQDGSWSQKP